MRKSIFAATFGILAFMVVTTWGFTRTEATPADLLEILPDGSGVAIIDFQKITASALWTTVSAQQKLASFIDKAQSEIADLGLKLNDVHTVVLCFPSANMSSPTAAINGSFDQKELLERLRSSSKVKLTSGKYKGFDVYNARSVPPSDAKPSSGSMSANAPTIRNEASFAFRDANTIVIGTTESIHASIDVMTGTRPSITHNSQLAEGLAQSPSAAIRFAIVVTPSTTKGLESSELPIPDFSSLKLIFGSIEVASGIDLNATLRSDSAESARAIADRLNSLLGMARGYLGAANNPKSTAIVEALKAVNITSLNTDIKITGSLTADLLSNLFASTERKSQ